MLSATELLLIKRFLFSKKTDGFISIFSWFSIIGITIGVSVIIIVMSVMNGFREELTSRLLGINGHVNIYSSEGKISKSDLNLINYFNDNKIKIFPLVETQALIINNNLSKGVYLRGYRSSDIVKDHFLFSKIIEGKIFSNNPDEIIIGYALANRLNLSVGDNVKIAIPKTDKTIFGNIPRFKTLSISGIFDLGMYEYDANFIFSNPEIPRKLLLINAEGFNKIEVFTKEPNLIESLQEKIDIKIQSLNKNLYSISWKESNTSLINALKVEKNVMFLILTLIILVASMNIISGLVIFVKEKNKDISILKTIGLSDISLVKIFIFIGISIGFIGTFFGTLIGIIFSLNISRIQEFIENFFKTDLFSKEIYYLSKLPARLDITEVFYVVIIALMISLLATVFPAYRSAKIDPIKALKNE